MERRQHKALNFDLDTNALKQYYPSPHYRQAYRDISRFLQTNGFEHRQWSGYRSLQAMSDAEITLLVTRLNARFPWLSKCINRFDVTNIGRNYDLSALFVDSDEMPEIEPVVVKKPEDGLDLPQDSLPKLKRNAKRKKRTIER